MNFFLLFLQSLFLFTPLDAQVQPLKDKTLSSSPVTQTQQVKDSSSQATYTDKSRKFTLQYPSELRQNVMNDTKQNSHDPQFLLSFQNNDEFAYFSLGIHKISFSSVNEWLNSVNSKLPPLGKIKIKKRQLRAGILFLTVNVPVIVDEDKGKPIYASQKQVVFQKGKELYTFLLREQLELPAVETQFDEVVASFRFL